MGCRRDIPKRENNCMTNINKQWEQKTSFKKHPYKQISKQIDDN